MGAHRVIADQLQTSIKSEALYNMKLTLKSIWAASSFASLHTSRLLSVNGNKDELASQPQVSHLNAIDLQEKWTLSN